MPCPPLPTLPSRSQCPTFQQLLYRTTCTWLRLCSQLPLLGCSSTLYLCSRRPCHRFRFHFIIQHHTSTVCIRHPQRQPRRRQTIIPTHSTTSQMRLHRRLLLLQPLCLLQICTLPGNPPDPLVLSLEADKVKNLAHVVRQEVVRCES